MAEFPALPLFTDAYLADTRHLTAEEHGAYLLLLMCAWRTRGCALRDDDRLLARIVGVTPARWRRLRPVLADFFTVADGQWRQKKLSAVYAGVEERVARNRENGAKGGRAKAARLAAAKEQASNGQARTVATKTRVQKPEPKAAEAGAGADVPDGWLPAAAAAAGLVEAGLDAAALAAWHAAGADLQADVLPTVTRLRARAEKKGGAAPRHLGYYTAAVLEARDARLGAVKAGRLHAAEHPPAPPKRAFDRTSAADWRLFLGPGKSRFRGDYLSANWRIGADHPHFLPTGLGPDPRAQLNPDIPADIFADYAAAFRWHRP